MADDRIRSLDGLRALAVLLVLVSHTFVVDWPTVLGAFQHWSPGPLGVRLFFVLSGFLITGILLSARNGGDRWYAWRAFYLRRSLRIFPLAYVVLISCWIVGLPAMREHPWWYLAYLSNWFDVVGIPPGLGLVHFWSLAIEEQFYLLWPALILWVPARALLPSIGIVIVIAGLSRLWLTFAISPEAAAFATISRMDALAWGAWLACRPVSARIQLACTALLLAIGALSEATWIVACEWAAILSCGAAMVGTVKAPTLIRLALTWRPLVGLGTISYGVYVLHHVIPEIARLIETRYDIWLRLPAYGLGRFVVISTLAILGAWLSWVWLERPLNDLKRYWPYSRQPQQAHSTNELVLKATSRPHLSD